MRFRREMQIAVSLCPNSFSRTPCFQPPPYFSLFQREKQRELWWSSFARTPAGWKGVCARVNALFMGGLWIGRRRSRRVSCFPFIRMQLSAGAGGQFALFVHGDTR